jgi:hypothetical protein
MERGEVSPSLQPLRVLRYPLNGGAAPVTPPLPPPDPTAPKKTSSSGPLPHLLNSC